MNDLKEIWTVDVNTPETNNQGITIYAVSTKEEALRRARFLNKNEAYGVIIDEDGDLVDNEYNDNVINNCQEYKYYNVGSFYVDETFYEEHDYE